MSVFPLQRFSPPACVWAVMHDTSTQSKRGTHHCVLEAARAVADGALVHTVLDGACACVR